MRAIASSSRATGSRATGLGRLAWSALLVLLASGISAPRAAAAAVPEVGKPAPALVARRFDGASIDLAALRGQVVVLNFWASWCGPCREEMPTLDALAREFQEQGVVVVGLSADDRHDRRDAQKAAQSVHYAVGMLSEAARNDFGEPRVLPLTYLIDREGVIRGILSANRGAVSLQTLREAIAAKLMRPL